VQSAGDAGLMLRRLESACRALAEAKSIPDVKLLRDQAAAVQPLLRQQHYCLAAQNDAAELKLRAERKLGELLAETVRPRAGAGRPEKNGSTKEPITGQLPAGVSKTQSHRWQLAASVPEAAFEAHVARRKADGAELTSESVTHLALTLKRESVESPPLPDGKYRCIICDPPWPAHMILRQVRPWQVELAYPTMSEEELLAFPLADLAAEDCHLYLWFTHKHLELALRLAAHWGFRYECQMTWEKNGGFTVMHSWQYTTEHVLFCRRGTLPLLRAGLPLHFAESRREHSRKPEAFYDLVRQASPEPRIELFARERRDGFDSWGNETERFQKSRPEDGG
jgi:N6-adenosine-specific RNA methylase IME4